MQIKPQTVNAGSGSIINQAGRDIHIHQASPEAVDKLVQQDLSALIKFRLFSEFNPHERAKELASNILRGYLIGCSSQLKSEALSWCARILSPENNNVEFIQECLSKAKESSACDALEIAKAFVESHQSKTTKTLKALSKINTKESKSASVIIICTLEGVHNTWEWLQTTSIKLNTLDAHAKSILLVRILHEKEKKFSDEILESIEEQDFQLSPILHHLVARLYLLNCVPDKVAIDLTHTPFNLADFPLSSDRKSLENRKLALKHFTQAYQLEKGQGFSETAKLDLEYKLWLEFRDSDTSSAAKQFVIQELRNHESNLILVHFALQFGIELDIILVQDAIEKR